MQKFILTTILLVFLVTPVLAVEERNTDPKYNFEILWKTIKENYGNFPAKKVDWDLLYRIYAPQITHDLSDEAFFELLCRMLDHLDDQHVFISNGKEDFSSGTRGETEKTRFSLKLIKAHYLKDDIQESDDGLFTWGLVQDDIPYVYFDGFDNAKGSGAVIDDVLTLCDEPKGIIIDVRDNGGGSDYVGRAIAGRFADKNGPTSRPA